jgi:hypothetical protein
LYIYIYVAESLDNIREETLFVHIDFEIPRQNTSKSSFLEKPQNRHIRPLVPITVGASLRTRPKSAGHWTITLDTEPHLRSHRLLSPLFLTVNGE